MNTRHLILFSAVSAALALASAAHAQTSAQSGPQDLAELSLEQLMDLEVDMIYSASKYEQRVTQAPSSISIVTAEEIRTAGHRTLDEVLRSVRGLFVSSDRNFAYLGFRGFQRPGDYTSRVLVLVDGHRINDNVGDSGMVDRSWMLDVELIERVEVIRGPGSSLYGSSAFFGVVNVVTKQGRQIDGLEMEAGAGSFDTYSGRITYGAAHPSGFDWLMSASHYDSAGPQRLYYPEYDQRISDAPGAGNDGFAEHLDGEQASKFFSRMRYGGLTASLYHNRRNKAVPTAPFGTIFNDPETHTVDHRSYADVKYELALSETTRFSARGYYDKYTYDGLLPYDMATSEAEVVREAMSYGIVGEWAGTEIQLTADVAERHTFVLGAEYRENLREDQQWSYEQAPGEAVAEGRHSSQMYAIFAQSETKLRDDLRLTLGVRLDEYAALDQTSVTPRAGLIYNPTERSAFKLLYGEAFRAPNPYERFTEHHLESVHRRLQPETIDTYEVVYERYLGRTYRLSLSAYRYAVKGLITAHELELGLQTYVNGEDVRAHGVEAEIQGKFDSGLQLRGSYAAQKTTVGSDDAELSSSPRHLAKLNMSMPLYGAKLIPSLELQYRGESLTLAGTRSRDYLTTNVQFTALPFGPKVELSLGVDNLFDVHVEYPASSEHLQRTLVQNGRTFDGRLRVRF